VKQYTLTDQEYVMKYLKENLLENSRTTISHSIQGRKNKAKSRKGTAIDTPSKSFTNIVAKPLDWETDEVATSLLGYGDGGKDFDLVIACDCIYNDALIQPLVQTCVEVCQLRPADATEPTLCIIAQQLRSSEVLEGWLRAFHKVFHVWRLPDNKLTTDLGSNSGFVIHIGILR
jgi:hypothetical protein